MKGIILAGGSGTRLFPITMGISKQLMPIYDKPMIYYPITTLISAGINEILIITTLEDNASFKKLLGNGDQFGISISYEVQEVPNGLAQAFVIGENFIGNDKVCLVLGDNIFHGPGINTKMNDFFDVNGAGVFAYWVSDPERYGVVEFDSNYKALSVSEKPTNPNSNYAIPGIYFYDNSVIEVAKNLKPSPRGEYEITDVNKYYLNKNQLDVGILNKGTVWLDTGTIESLNDASEYVRVIEKRQGIKIGCIEEAAYKKGFISKSHLIEIGDKFKKSGYGSYLQKIASNV
jgi:glucose-1-phosphate thymidylyltransferase